MRNGEGAGDAFPDRGRRGWLWFWSVFTVLAAALLLAKRAADARWEQVVAQQQAAFGTGGKNMRTLHDRLWAMQRPGRRPEDVGVTREQVEAAFGATGTITWVAPAPQIHFRYVDSASGFIGTFHLQANGYSAQWGSGSSRTPPRWGEPIDRLRRRATNLVAVAWVPLFVLTCVYGRRSRALRHLLVAVALLATLGWLLAPNYSITWRGVRSNDPLFFAIVMLVFSVSVSVWCALHPPGWRRGPDDHPLCEGCGYDLSFNESGACPECWRRHGLTPPPSAAIGAGA